MRFLFFLRTDTIFPIALKIQEEGHEVGISTTHKGLHPNSGLHRVNWKQFITNDTICLIDSIAYDIGEQESFEDYLLRPCFGDVLRNRNYIVIGGNKYGEMIQLHERFGLAEAVIYHMNIPITYYFEDIEDALAELEKLSGDWYFRSRHGVCIVNKDKPVDYLKSLQSDCLLQQKLDGIPINLEGWFDGESFIDPAFITLTDNHIFMGKVVLSSAQDIDLTFPVSINGELFKNSLWNMRRKLKKEGYIGVISADLILNKDERPSVVGFKTNMKCESLFCMAEFMKDGISQFFSDFIKRKAKKCNIPFLKEEEIIQYKSINALQSWGMLQ